jgi:hypothetical protein
MADKCKSQKNNGSRCGANAQPSNGLCVFHDPARASDGQRVRSAGGVTRSTVAAVLPSDTPDHPLGNVRDVSALLTDSINRLRRGQLDPRVANAMGYLTSVLLRALEQGPVEERLAKIEAALAANTQPALGAQGSLSAAMMRNANPAFLEQFTRYRREFIDAIAVNMANNGLSKDDRSLACGWLDEGHLDEEEFAQQVDAAMGTLWYTKEAVHRGRVDVLWIRPEIQAQRESQVTCQTKNSM